MSTQNKANRFIGLEALRFLCAISVLMYHYPVFTFVGGQIENFQSDALPFYSLLNPLFDRGFFAVQYFWCISGFIFFWKYQRSLRNRISGREFFVLRFSRLYPLHFATLIFIAGVQLIHKSLTGTFLTYINNTVWTFAQNLVMLGSIQHPRNDSFNGVIWSVSVEVIAYVTFYFICRYIRHSGIAALVFGVACAIAFVAAFINNKFLECFALFYLGGVACIVYRWLDQRRLTSPAAIVCFAYYIGLWWLRNQWPSSGYLRIVICIPFVVLGFACLPMPRFTPTKLIQAAGNLTYSIYLLHFPVILTAMTASAAVGVHLDYRSPVLLVSFVSTVLVLAALCYRFFELPAQRYLRSALLQKSRRALEQTTSGA